MLRDPPNNDECHPALHCCFLKTYIEAWRQPNLSEDCRFTFKPLN
jgi:hypothetical protein